MHVSISNVPRPGRRGAGTREKVDELVVPFVQSLRSAYIAEQISDDESATKDLLTDILVYASIVEDVSIEELAAEAARAANGELFDYDHD